jgi:hypothetical protein
MDYCLICGKPVPDYVAEGCCDGRECGCMGQAINPCICSEICYTALIDGIGKSYEERRINSGIERYTNDNEH